MKKILVVMLSLLSLSAFAKTEDFRDDAVFKATTADAAYALALDVVSEIKSARYNESLPYLKNCNLRPNQWDDNFFFKRKAWTQTSYVSYDFVTKMYSAIVKVACTIK